MTFVSYGLDKLNRNYWNEKSKKSIKELRRFSRQVNKPIGLWACPINAKLSWRNYVEESNARIASDPMLREYYRGGTFRDLDKKIDFRLSMFSKILVIDSVKKLEKVFEIYGLVKLRWGWYEEKTFDWERIEHDYDGIYIEISSLESDEFDGPIWDYNLDKWCVDSLCIWNMKKIRVI